MISIVKSDTVLFAGGVGYANIEDEEPVNELHLFRQGSVSKTFTALGILKLLHHKGIGLNKPILEIDPNIPLTNPWANEQPITIEHLLEHTSGFDDFHLHAIYNKTDSTTPTTASMVQSHKNSLTARWQPGTRKAYSNSGFIVAGHMLETIAEEPYNTYLRDEILLPLGMKSSGFYFKQPTDLAMSQGYNYRGTGYSPVAFTSIQGGPAGEICANAKDMAAFLQFMLNRKSSGLDSVIFAKEAFDRMENAQTNIASQKGLPNGYGLGNYSIWKNGYLFNGHGGGIDGFSSRYVYSRKADLGIAVAINRMGNATAMLDEILDLLIGPQTKPPADRITYPIPAELKEKYSGFYGFKNPRNELFGFSDRMFAGLILDFEGDKIITKSILGKARDTLRYVGNNQFYKNNEGVPSTLLFETTDGKPGFWINESYTEMESRAWRLISNFAIWISMILPLFFLLYSIIWLVIQLAKKRGKSLTNHLVLGGACLSYVLMFTMFALSMNNMETAGEMSFKSVMLYILSFVFVGLAALSVYRWTKLPKKRGFRFYYILTSLAVVILSIFFWSNGFIGLKLWAY